MIKNLKKTFSIFSKIVLCSFLVLSFYSCSNLVSKDEQPDEPEKSVTSDPQENNNLTLVVTPVFSVINKQFNIDTKSISNFTFVYY